MKRRPLGKRRRDGSVVRHDHDSDGTLHRISPARYFSASLRLPGPRGSHSGKPAIRCIRKHIVDGITAGSPERRVN